jgi:hypothetical protein
MARQRPPKPPPKHDPKLAAALREEDARWARYRAAQPQVTAADRRVLARALAREMNLPEPKPGGPDSKRPPRKKAWRWRRPPPDDKLKDAMQAIAKTYPQDARPGFDEIWIKLKDFFPGLPRKHARQALKKYAPRLQGRRGYRKTKSPT